MTSSEPSVRRDQAESYLVTSANGLEYARIFLLDGQRPNNQYWGYVSIVSSYGLFGHCFSHIHVPIKSFLQECDRDYLLNKLMDGQAQDFDYDASLAHIRTLIATSVSPDRQADLLATLDSIDDLGLTQEAFGQAIQAAFPDLWEQTSLWEHYAVMRPSRRGVTFYKTLWLPFLAALKAEQLSQA